MSESMPFADAVVVACNLARSHSDDGKQRFIVGVTVDQETWDSLTDDEREHGIMTCNGVCRVSREP